MDNDLEKMWYEVLETLREFAEIVKDIFGSLAETTELLSDIDDILVLKKNKFRKCAATVSPHHYNYIPIAPRNLPYQRRKYWKRG